MRFNKMLRGTRKNQVSAAVYRQRPTLQNQITRLQAQVSANKPETQYFRSAGNHTASAGTPEITNYLITSSLISSLDFRDKVTGDTWANLFLKFRLYTEPTNGSIRVLVYSPKKVGGRFAPSSFAFVTIPDPSSFWVLYDQVLTDDDVNGHNNLQRTVSLRKLKTIYDSNAAAIQRGEVILSIISQGTSGTIQYSYGYELGFHNK